MVTINTLEDFLQALDDNPSWREAVRARILGEELLQLPAKFDAFVERQEAFNERQEATNKRLEASIERLDAFVERQEAFNERMQASVGRLEAFAEEQRTFNAEQRVINANFTARFGRMEGDMSTLKANYARDTAVQDAKGIALDMGLELVRVLTIDDLTLMGAGAGLPRNIFGSFRKADLVMEAASPTGPCYVAMEFSFTADSRDCERVLRNADLLTRFTGMPAQAAVASVRNDREATEMMESNGIYWHQMEDRTPRPE